MLAITIQQIANEDESDIGELVTVLRDVVTKPGPDSKMKAIQVLRRYEGMP